MPGSVDIGEDIWVKAVSAVCGAKAKQFKVDMDRASAALVWRQKVRERVGEI